MEEKVIGIDYENEYHRLRKELEETKQEIEKYRQALLNICLNMEVTWKKI